MTTLRNISGKTRSLLTATLLALAASSALGAGVPAVLNEIPGDARAVVVIGNVKDLGTKVSNIAVRLNLPAVPPDLAGYLTRMIGITKGFDDTGSAALAVLAQSKEQEAEGGPPAMVVLLPTTDPKAMMEAFQPAAPDDKGISEVTLPGDRAEKGYTATIAGKWLALAQDKAHLEAYLARKNAFAKTVAAESLKSFENNDLVLWADVPALTKGFDKLLEDKQQEITGMFDLVNLNNNQDPVLSAIQKAAINEYFLALKQYLKDASAAMLTVRISDAGPTLGLIGTFKPESPFGKFVAAQKPNRPIDLTGLPNGDFLMAASFAWDPASMAALSDEVVKRVMADEVVAKDPKAEKFKASFDIYRQIIARTSGTSVVMLEPAGGGGAAKNGIFNGAYIVDSPDAAKLHALQLEALKSPLAQESMVADLKQEMKVTADAVTIKAVKLTKIHTSFTLREETPDKPLSPVAKQQYAMIQKMYGPDGVTMYTGVVGKRLLVVMGSDAGILEAAVTAAQNNGAELNNHPAIAAAKEQIVPGTVGVAYINAVRWLNLAQSIIAPGAAAAGAGGGGGGGPIVASAGVNGSTLTTELHVPTTTITAIKDAIPRMMQMMMGGGMPPAPPEGGGEAPMQP